MAKLESYSNLSKLQEDLWKKNFCSNFDLGLSVYSKASDLSFKSSFTQKSSAKGSSTFGSTYFQYKAAQWLLKEQFTSASLFKGTFEYTHPKLSQAKFKLELETNKPNEYKHTLSGEFSHDNYKVKGSLVNLNDLKLNFVAGTNGNGAGADLTFKIDQKKLSNIGAALWTFKPTWRGVLKYTAAEGENFADIVGSLYLSRCEKFEFGAAVGWKNQAVLAQGTVQYNFEKGKLLKARIDQEGKLALGLRTKVGGVTLINGTEFSLLDNSGKFNYGFRVKINQ
jgi:hypothetical protein